MKSNKVIEVKDCNNCPFCIYDIDYESVGDSHLAYCAALDFSNILYTGEGHGKLKTPEWCPLKQESITVVLND